MSERKGGAHASKRVQVKISSEFGDRLTTLTQSSHMNKKEMIHFFIELSEKYGFHKPGWAERLNKSLDMVDHEEEHKKFLEWDGKCPALVHGDDGYVCVWARKLKTPIIKRLAMTKGGAEKICMGCFRSRELLDGIADYEDQIKALRAEVGRGVLVEVPRCELGSKLNDDGTEFYCQRQAIRIKVTGCKTLRKGSPCKDLRFIALNAKGKFAEPEDSR